MECSCSCGSVSFETAGEPLFRILCHCTICQRFHNAPFADVLVHRAEDVALPRAEAVEFDTHKRLLNVRRGRCTTCRQPAIAIFAAPALPKLVMVFRSMFGSDAELPSPAAHIFYDSRVSDTEDLYPKHHGFIRSQCAFLKYLWSARRP